MACSAIQVFPAPVGAVTRQSASSIAAYGFKLERVGFKRFFSRNADAGKHFF